MEIKRYTQLMRRMTVIATVVLLLYSCTDSTLFHAYKAVDKDGWARQDTLTFNLPEDSVHDTYFIKIGLRTMDSYRYTSLWIVMKEDLQEKGVFVRDTFNIPVTDGKGQMHGQGFISHQLEMPVKNIKVNKKGGTTIQLYHIMKREVVPGISDVGINVSSDSLQHLYGGI